ncbi:hypothetical protein L798_03053 [Zootermopsis nevadensis]|uniref:Ionotropic glutamate receptor C-terminal domain-containing protein n=1 Tax=Zootermopsis nevadensis TaxID=136037 RepID=A0A067RQK7_ZOONE|nr:hypothetical protein L798_03053 [Zootermopsis nevadensis]
MNVVQKVLLTVLLCDFYHFCLPCLGHTHSFRELYVNNRTDEREQNTDDKSFCCLVTCFFTDAQYITLITIVNLKEPEVVTEISTELIALFHHRVQMPVMTFYGTTDATIHAVNVLSDSRRDVLFITENIASVGQYLDEDRDNKTRWHATDNLFIGLVTTSNRQLHLSDYEMKYRELFQRIWTRYNVLNILFLDSRISPRFWHGTGTSIVTFNPFLKNGNVRGMVQAYNITDANTVCQRFERKLDDLHGYPLRVTMFGSYPYAPRIYSGPTTSQKYGGVDGNVLNVVTQLMNFTPVLHRPKDKIKFGFRTKDGTFVGSLGDIVYGKSDIAFNSHYIKNYDDAQIQFITPPIMYDGIVILVPKSQLIPGWMDLFECFHLTELLFILTFYVISVCFGTFVKRYLGTEINIYEISRIAICILKMFLTVPIVGTRELTSFSERVFASSCLLFGVLMVTAIQVTLVTEISSPNYYPDIDTLEQLAESGLPIATSYQNLLDTFSDTENPTMIRLAKNVRFVSDSFSIKERIAYKMDYAAITSLSNVPYFLSHYIGPSDNPLLHAVEEKPRGYFLSYVVPKYSPYLRRINILTATLTESGVVGKWEADEVLENQIIQRHDHTHIEKSTLHAYSMNDLQTAFFVLVFGLSCGSVVFVAEIVVAFKLFSWK